MRKYNKKILTALVIAYKKGIINRKPLNRWLSVEKIFNRVIRQLCYLIIFLFLFLIFDNKALNFLNLEETLIISGYIVEKSRIISGISLGFMMYVVYKLLMYLNQVFIVKKALKDYKEDEFDIEKLDNITFKIHM